MSQDEIKGEARMGGEPVAEGNLLDEDLEGGARFEGEQERVLTLKVDLEGPAEVVSWLRENARPRRRNPLFLPEGFWRHMRAAQREQLLAVRSLLDAAIDRVSEKPAEESKKARRQAVDVEVE